MLYVNLYQYNTQIVQLLILYMYVHNLYSM